MKKNILLTFIFFTLFGIAFFSEEVYKKQFLTKRKEAVSIIKSTKMITELQAQNFHIVKEGNLWVDKTIDWPLSQGAVVEFLDILGHLRISEEILPDGTNSYFENEDKYLKYKTNGEWNTITLGNISEVTGAFYLKLNQEKKIYVSYDRSYTDMLHRNEDELNIKRYMRLVNIFNSSSSLFIKQNLLELFLIDKATSLVIDNKRNRSFKIDLQQSITIPKAPKEIKYVKFRKLIKKSLAKIKVKRIVSSGQNILTNPRSVITVELPQQKNIVLKLYSGLNKKFGYFLKTNLYDNILELDAPEGNLFFTNRQDFWKKRIDYGVVFTDLEKIEFQLGYNPKQMYPFVIEDLKKFVVKAKSKKVKFISKVHINFLFNLIFNLTEFKQASYIDEGVNSSVKKYDLYMKIFNKYLQIKIAKNLILIYDKQAKILYNYKYNTKQIHMGFFNKIFTVK